MATADPQPIDWGVNRQLQPQLPPLPPTGQIEVHALRVAVFRDATMTIVTSAMTIEIETEMSMVQIKVDPVVVVVVAVVVVLVAVVVVVVVVVVVALGYLRRVFRDESMHVVGRRMPPTVTPCRSSRTWSDYQI